MELDTFFILILLHKLNPKLSLAKSQHNIY